MVYGVETLMPYSNNMVLDSLTDKMRVLKLLMFFYNAMREGIQSFIAASYEDFDAQVSENLCQIRAYQLALAVEDKEKYCIKAFDVFLKEIEEVQYRCDILFDEYKVLSRKRPSHYTEALDKSGTFLNWLENCKLKICFNDAIYFLVQTYILSQYKLIGKFNISQGIDYEKFCSETGASKTYARKIIHRLQRNVSELSCRFIFKILGQLEINQYQYCLLKSLYHEDEVGRHVMPCYEVTNIILQHALCRKKPIQIISTRISQNEEDIIKFILSPSLKGDCYILMANDIKRAEGMITFTGISRYEDSPLDTKEEYIFKFLDVGFENIILANMAQHPQYAGLLLDSKKYNPYLGLDLGGFLNFNDDIRESERAFLRHKSLSNEIGCSVDNAGLFLLTHVRYELGATELKSVHVDIESKETLLVA